MNAAEQTARIKILNAMGLGPCGSPVMRLRR
jgi:hypothetical protein